MKSEKKTIGYKHIKYSNQLSELTRPANMEILILLLISPAIFAQRYRKHVNPNDEPFLPIHPIYPYSPKLTKRGSDKDIVPLLKPELYAPRTDARDSYTASYAGMSKDPYFPSYGSYPQSSSAASYSPYSSYYGNNLYGVYSGPYNSNPYVTNPYISGTQNSGPYSGYYQQPPYFYPDYYERQYNPYPFSESAYPGGPPPPGPPRNEKPNLNGGYPLENYEQSKSGKPKGKEDLGFSFSGDFDGQNGSGNQYVDGNNFISQNYKEFSSPQASGQYKTSSPYINQRDQITNLHLKGPHIQPPPYKVISVGGQLVEPNYSLPSNYARIQLMEQVAAVQNLAKSLGYAFPGNRQATGSQSSKSISSYLPYAAAITQQNLPGRHQVQQEFYSSNQNPPTEIQEEQYYSSISSASMKPEEAHVYGSEDHDLPNKKSNNQFLGPMNLQISDRKLAGAQDLGQGDKSSDKFTHSSVLSSKTPSEYRNLPYTQKPMTSVTFERSQTAYISPEKMGTSGEEAFGDSSLQSYDQPPFSQGITQGTKNSYGKQNAAQAYTYHLTNYRTLPRGSQQPAKTNLEDVNFGSKQDSQG